MLCARRREKGHNGGENCKEDRYPGDGLMGGGGWGWQASGVAVLLKLQYPPVMTTAHEDVIEFLAQGMTPHELVAFRPSVEASERFEWLIRKEKSDGLLREEREELDRAMEVERVLSLAKARARARLSSSRA